MWIVAEPLRIEEARAVLKDAVPKLDQYLAASQLEMVSARDWFLKGGNFDGKRLTDSWYEKLAGVSARGYPWHQGDRRYTWLTKKDWGHFCDYEDGLNEVIGNRRLAVLCTYPLAGRVALRKATRELGGCRDRRAEASQSRNPATQR